jgi:hypothetical protein
MLIMRGERDGRFGLEREPIRRYTEKIMVVRYGDGRLSLTGICRAAGRAIEREFQIAGVALYRNQ